MTAPSPKNEGAAFEALILECEGESGAEWCLASHDTVTAPVVLVWGEEVHGAAFTLRAAGVLYHTSLPYTRSSTCRRRARDRGRGMQ